MKIPVPKVIQGIQCFPINGKSAAKIRAIKQLEIDEDRFDEEYPDWIGFGCPCKRSYELGATIAAPSHNFRHCPAHDRNHGHLMHVGEGFALNQLPIYSQAFLLKIVRSLPHLYDGILGPSRFCTDEQVSMIEQLLFPFAASLPFEMLDAERKFLTLRARTKFYEKHPIVYYC